MADSLDTRSAAGRLVLNIMVSVSQWEREAIGERTRDAMRHKRANGEHVGTLPFGYRLAADGVTLEPDHVEQAILARIQGLRAEGRTLRQIAAALNREGLRTRRGTAWRHQYVQALRSSLDSLTLSTAAYRPRAPVQLEEFADSQKRAEWVRDKNLTVFSLYSTEHAATFVSLSDLLSLKRQAGRAQDRLDIEQLEALDRARGGGHPR